MIFHRNEGVANLFASLERASKQIVWLCVGSFALREAQQFGFHPVPVCVTPCLRCAVSSAGAAAGEASGDVQEDAGTAADGRKVPPSHRPGAGHGETQTRRLHEQKRRLHKPSGAGEREVRVAIVRLYVMSCVPYVVFYFHNRYESNFAFGTI